MNMVTKGWCPSLALLAMVSCGGGSSSDVAGGGIGGTGITQGPITGFGSVIVNGIRFEDAGAAIEMEDVPNRLRTDLKIGMVVKIEWEKDATGTYIAKTIVYGDDVQGPVRGIGVDGVGDATFTVLGQHVMTHPRTTVFNGVVDAAALVNGNIVEISGLKDAAGVIHATFVDFKNAVASAGETFELKGVVKSLDSIAKTFRLGAVIVHYSTLTAPVMGTCVEVKSTVGIMNGHLVASAIEVDDDCTPVVGSEAEIESEAEEIESEAHEVEVEGYPSAIDKTANTFTVNGQLVSYTETAFERGSNEATLSSSRFIEVEGILSRGVLIAENISIELEHEVKGLAQGAVAMTPLQ